MTHTDSSCIIIISKIDVYTQPKKELIYGSADPSNGPFARHNLLSKELLAWDFKQLVKYPSHIEENVINHVYISDKVDRQLVVLDQHPVYYI